MDFGRVEDPGKADIKLPKDHSETSKVLNGKAFSRSEVWVGCAKWARKDWLGKIYPNKTKDKDFLDHYVKNFNSVELNATYHRIPSPSVVKAWTMKTGKEKFLFCPKFPREITHTSSFEGKERPTKYFLEITSSFEKHLGAYFLLVPPSFNIKRFPELKEYLKNLPDISLFLEFRHPSWFEQSEQAEEAFEFFRKNKTGVLLTDTLGRRDCLHMRLTIPEAFIRFVGNGLHPTDYKRIDDWVQRINIWLKTGLKTLYFFIHNDSEDNEAHSPELCAYTIQKLNKECGLKLRVPKIIKQEKLF